MNNITLAIIISLAASIVASSAADVKVWFSPNGGCEAEIVSEISKAQSIILIQAYNFTSSPIGDALSMAVKRSVKVLEIQDGVASRQKNNQCAKLKMVGGSVFVDRKHAIAHNKIMLIDGKTILTGSFNFSDNAERRNAENLLRITADSALVKSYQSNWSNHLAHCQPYVMLIESPKVK